MQSIAFDSHSRLTVTLRLNRWAPTQRRFALITPGHTRPSHHLTSSETAIYKKVLSSDIARRV